MRRTVLALALVLVAASAAAFDSSAWFARRARMERAALELRAAYSNCVANLTAPAEDLTVPIEHFPDGAVKATISAKRAQFFLDTGYVWGEGVIVKEFDRAGEVVSSIFAESCVVDRGKKCGWAEGAAKATHGKTSVEGVGIYFSFSEEYVKLFSNVVIRSEDMKLKGVKL